MRHQVPGLQVATPFPERFFLVRVAWAQCRSGVSKPYLALSLAVTEPASMAGRKISTRLYCTPKALWKMNWFLRDFGYDSELLERDEIDDKAVVGLQGIIKLSQSDVNGRNFMNVDGFAPAGDWDEFRLEKAG